MKIEDLERRAAELAAMTEMLVTDMIAFSDHPEAVQNINASCRMLLSVRIHLDLLEAPIKALSKHHNLLKQVVVPKLFGDTDTTTLTAFGYRFTVSTRLTASFSDKQAGHNWLRENELGDIIKPTVNAQTLSSTARSLIEEGKELDPGIFNINYVENTSITKVKITAP